MHALRLVVFVVTYAAIAFPRLFGFPLTRSAAAFIGAAAMVAIGRLPLQDAYAAIDLNVLTFLFGVLLLAAYLELGGFFEWAARHIIWHTRSPRTLLAVLVIVTGISSAFFMNDTLCLVLTPLTITILRPLRLRPLPYLLAIALSANVGSAMAITGNPQNMLIGIASGISYGRFLQTLALPSIGGLLIVYTVVTLTFRQDFRRGLLAMHPVSTAAAPGETSFDRRLVITTLLIFAGTIVGWLVRLPLPLVSICGAAVLILGARRDPSSAFARVDWSLLVFFAALFITVRGVRSVPMVQDLTTNAVTHIHAGTGAHVALWNASVVSATMLILSNLVSNVPAILLWRPLVPSLPNAEFIWLAMAMSSSFAGNLSLLGSMANLIVAEGARARGVTLSFGDYLQVGIPVTLLTMAWGITALVMVA
jgi:Na+/H+ antiporter NhaD/arsenite permease-like protein